jgi:hypothetical protein
MVIVQNKQKPLTPRDDKKIFALSALKGSIGKALVETYFTYFGYETYPYGYENHYANVTRFIKKDHKDKTITKIRAMPDLLVFDRDRRESYLVEIKASTNVNMVEFWIEKGRFDTYKDSWSEAILIVYSIPLNTVYSCRVSEIIDIQDSTLPNTDEPGYFLNLNKFHTLPYYFPNMRNERYERLNMNIASILRSFSGTTLQQLYPVTS